MITVAVLYVVVTGLTETGAVSWIGQSLLGHPRSDTEARLRLMLPVAAISAFLNNTPVVAIFIPAVLDWAKRHRLALSGLLIPLSFASIVGGTCTLIGTSTNLVVDGLFTARTGAPGLGLFELAWIGLPVAAAALAFLAASDLCGGHLRGCPALYRRDGGRGKQPAGRQEHRGGRAAPIAGAVPGGDRAAGTDHPGRVVTGTAPGR
jgi:di/tricarboxylate transporter